MLCEKKDDKRLFAIKSIRKENIIEQDQVKNIQTERKLLEHMIHPFLISLEYAF
jgi:serine/threonine protein kinase